MEKKPFPLAMTILVVTTLMCCLLVILLTPWWCSVTNQPIAETIPAAIRAAKWFEAHRHRPPMLRAVLQRMPKGGDLHSHLSGAVYAESYLDWARDKKYCVDLAKNKLLKPSKSKQAEIVEVKTLTSDQCNTIINGLSTRNLSHAGRSGRDQFFAAFGGFGEISSRYDLAVKMLTDVANNAAAQHIQYLEVMVTFEGDAMRELARRMPPILRNSDADPYTSQQEWLMQQGLGKFVAKTQKAIEAHTKRYFASLKCDTPEAQPACGVNVRLIAQTNRNYSPEEVFAQLVFAFELTRSEHLVAGINLVSPEDNPIALRDYTMQMEMVGFLSAQDRNVHISLHAGELTLGLVRPKDLRFHIREAVEIAHAHRIGHGVDILYEDDALKLIEEMRSKHILVEICLTSNDIILGVKGPDHPLPDYLNANVPVTLASDDEGVSRIDLTNEYLQATIRYGLTYPDLKRMVRNSLEYSFLPGESIWQDPDAFNLTAKCAQDVAGKPPLSTSCTNFLNGNERAQEQWRLEVALSEFEKLPWFD